jgi:hypothetical protein
VLKADMGKSGSEILTGSPPFFENLLLLKHFFMLGKVQNFEPIQIRIR